MTTKVANDFEKQIIYSIPHVHLKINESCYVHVLMNWVTEYSRVYFVVLLLYLTSIANKETKHDYNSCYVYV